MTNNKLSTEQKETKANELPEMGKVVRALCKRGNGTEEEHFIRRIKSKDSTLGWQWSHNKIDTYFTLEVLSWTELLIPYLLQENATHKAVRDNSRINIFLKGFEIEGDTYPDEFLYSISSEDEDDLFAIFERYDEDNRINMAEFKAEIQNI